MKILFNIFEFFIKFWFPTQETKGSIEMEKKFVPDKIDMFFSRFVDTTPDAFYEMVLQAARQDKAQQINLKLVGIEVEDELMNLHNGALERARKIEEHGTHDDRWREMASILRKVAQIIFNESDSKSEHKGFLRLVK